MELKTIQATYLGMKETKTGNFYFEFLNKQTNSIIWIPCKERVEFGSGIHVQSNVEILINLANEYDFYNDFYKMMYVILYPYGAVWIKNLDIFPTELPDFVSEEQLDKAIEDMQNDSHN